MSKKISYEEKMMVVDDMLHKIRHTCQDTEPDLDACAWEFVINNAIATHEEFEEKAEVKHQPILKLVKPKDLMKRKKLEGKEKK